MSAIEFELYVYELLKREFRGCDIREQPTLDSGARPDFILDCDEELIVVDAKDKERLTLADIDQMIDYMDELDANSGMIYVADDTDVPESVEDYAVENGIEIEYAQWRA